METVEDVLHIEPIREIERQCRNYYNVEPKIRNWRQYNLGRVEEGWEYWEESKRKESFGHYKITQPWRKDKDSTLSQHENRCIYWEEYWYNKFDSEKQLNIFQYLIQEFKCPINVEPADEPNEFWVIMYKQFGSGSSVQAHGTFDVCIYKILCVIYPYLTPNQILKIKEILEG